jgi:hypothetical protein
MAKDFDFTEEVRGLRVPTLIVAADADHGAAQPLRRGSACSTAVSATAGGWAKAARRRARVAILPGLTHYSTSARRCSPR